MKTLSFVCSLFCLFLAHTVDASSPSSCQRQFHAYVDLRLKGLETKYKDLDPSFVKIQDPQRPVFIEGRRNEIVYTLHGFMGSPHEMSQTSAELKRRGFALYHDLLPGHGAHAGIANAFDSKTWIVDLHKTLTMLESCYSAIHVVGFSTGGLLLFNELVSHPHTKVKTAIFYSPYFESSAGHLDLLGRVISWATPSLSVDTLYSLTHFPDLRVMIKTPSAYLQQVPTATAVSIVDLGRQVRQAEQLFWSRSQPATEQLQIPALLFVSSGDAVVFQQTSIDLIRSRFSSVNVQRYLNLSVPHHLMAPEVSPVAQEVSAQTLSFIGQ